MLGKTNRFKKSDLNRFTNEPLPRQYNRIVAKIVEAINWTGGDIVICFSGGKDSALILDMYCDILSTLFPTLAKEPIKVAWANTTNETLSMQKYVRWFIRRCEEEYGVTISLDEVRPSNNNTVVDVMKREGLPFISKMVSGTLRKVRKSMDAAGVEYNDIKNLHKPTVQCRDALREMGLNDTTVLAMTGWSVKRNDFGTGFVLPLQWLPLLNIKKETGCDIEFSDICCFFVKKEPLSRLNYINTMTGEQAVESRNREYAWLRTGCNYGLPDGSIKSKPLGAVSLDAVLYALQYRKTPIAPDYGEIEYCSEKECFRCTKAQRTGCALCGFGIKYDPQRFVRLQETEPAKVRAAFKPFEKGGLGYKETCEYLNEYCGTKIIIPKV